ncbi:hypothetical protein [Desulfonauticus submarinus]
MIGKEEWQIIKRNMIQLEMKKYKFTKYFENEVLRKRLYIKKEWCIKVIENPIKVEKQEGNRWRFWGIV